jgi:osmoprotectant transport system substrate-binding protein
MIAMAACAPALAQALVVGGKNFTEQLVVAEITAQLLRAKGFSITTRTGFATTGVRTEQEMGHIDLYWEYTGTSLVTFNKVADKLEPDQTFRKVKELDLKRGLVWLTPSHVSNTYALAMRETDAAAQGIGSISDLAAKARSGERFRLATNLEFYLRPDGLLPLQRTYGFEFGQGNVLRTETNAVYEVLRNSPDIDVGVVFSTDGRVSAFGLSLLKDDRHFFPSYVLAPVVRSEVLDRYPDLAGHMSALASKLDNPTMARLNAMVDLENRSVEEVAAVFLKEHGLL